jgi:hypothetical protein
MTLSPAPAADRSPLLESSIAIAALGAGEPRLHHVPGVVAA